MQTPYYARRGMVTSPHHLASQAGLAVLREGGNAIEAAIAAAATLTAVAPHMTGLGGDAFWLIAEPGKPPISIDGSGAAGAKVEPALFRKRGLKAIPTRGPMSACTVAGAVSSWQLALDVSSHWGGRLPLSRLFADAIHAADDGIAVGGHLAQTSARTQAELKGQPGFAAQFLNRRKPLAAGQILRLPALAETYRHLGNAGLDDFYRGALGRTMAADLADSGSPLVSDDLARHRGMRRRPLSLGIPAGTLYNTAPPTQGLASLMVMGLFQRLNVSGAGGFDHAHGLIEAAKRAQMVRDVHITDPGRMSVHATTYLTEGVLDHLAEGIDRAKASPWPVSPLEGDTVWLGVVDAQGRAVSLIQSVMHAFGSGVVLPSCGITWHCRGSAFSLEAGHRNLLEPRRRPPHTLSPGLARLKDGRTVVYGTMGGDAQPLIQAQILSRLLMGQTPQEALSAPRWALGRSLDGQGSAAVQVEARLPLSVREELIRAGHDVQVVGEWDWLLGQAGLICRRADGLMEGGYDPRSDGSVAAY